MTKSRAIELFEECASIRKGGVHCYTGKVKLNSWYDETLELIDKIPDRENLKVSEVVFCIRNNYNQIPVCKTCKKEIPFKIEKSNKKVGPYIKKYCSITCFNNDPEVKAAASKRETEMAEERLEKRKKTVIEKYGSWESRPGGNNFEVSNTRLKEDKTYRDARNKKTKETNMARYGVEYTNQLEGEGQRRRKVADETCLKKYGVKNPGSIPSVIQQNLVNNFKGNLKNYKSLTKEILENDFLDKDRKIKRLELKDFLGCSNETIYSTFRKFGINFVKKTSGGVGWFHPDKPTRVYYVKDNINGLYKIGITTLEVRGRFGPEFKNFTVLNEWEFDNGLDAFTMEQEILEEYQEFRVENTRIGGMGGRTEFFSKDVLELDNLDKGK